MLFSSVTLTSLWGQLRLGYDPSPRHKMRPFSEYRCGSVLRCTGGSAPLFKLLGHLEPDVPAALVEGHFHAGKLIQHRREVAAPVGCPPLHLLRHSTTDPV